MEPEILQERMAQFLQQHEIPAQVCWQEGCRKRLQQAQVLVSLAKLNCHPAGLQNYLGQCLDEKTGQIVEWYGRQAQLEFALDILAPAGVGAGGCRELFHRLVAVLHRERPIGLTVRELTGEEIEFDQKEGLFRLNCTMHCDGWLWAAGDEAADILDFTLRGDWNG